MAVDMCYFCKNNCVIANSMNCKNYTKGTKEIFYDLDDKESINRLTEIVVALIYRDD